MTISLRAAGATTAAAGAVTGVTAGVPAGLTSTDISVLTVEAKQATAGTAVTISTPAGWTLIGSVTNNGTNLTAANDVGTNYVAMFYRVGTYTAPTITTSGANSMGAGIVAYQTTAGLWDVSATASGSDTTSGANGSITAGSVLGSATGDLLVVGAGLSGDLGTVTAQSVTATGATFGTLAAHINLGVTTGTDSRLLVSSFPVTAGTATAAPIYTWTNTSSLTGHGRFVRLREVAPTPTISDSISSISGMTARWRADQITGLSSGASVATWPDASGFAFDATQATALNRPTWQASSINGQPAVRFAGSPQTMASSASTSDNTQTVLAVFRASDLAGSRTLRGASGTGGLQFRVEPDGRAGLVSQSSSALGTSTIGTSVATNAAFIGVYDRPATTTNIAFYVDGADAGSFTSGAFLVAGQATLIGGHAASAGEYFQGDIAEIITWNRLLTAPELASVHSYVTSRYGISASTPILIDNARAETRASRPLLSQASPLTVRAARSATRASRPLLTQQQPTLTVRAARSATRAGRPLLTQQQGILVRAARSAARTSRPQLTQQQATLTITGPRATTRTSRALLTQATSLTVAAARAHTRTGPALLAQDAPLTIRGARAAATASHPVLSQHSPLTVRPARAATRAQDARLAATGQVAVYDTRTQTRASRPTLTQDTPLTVHGARTATRTATATLTSAAPTLTIRGARSQTRAAVAALEQLQLLTVAGARAPTRARRVTLTETAATGSPARTHTVPADNRTTSVAPDNRNVSVPPDPRTVHVAAEDRTHTVPAATRILTSA